MKIKQLNQKEFDGFFRNILALTKKWTEDLEKGKKAEEVVMFWLTQQGHQVYRILHYKHEEQDKLYSTEEKIKQAEETIFAPDFLVFSESQLFFADVKGKSKKQHLGWVNKRDYDKYFKTMQKVQGIGFKIYFYIEETGEIFQLDELIEPKDFEVKRQPDGLVYVIPPEEHLMLVARLDSNSVEVDK